MPTIHRLENNRPEIGGILVTFDNNRQLSASWYSLTPIDSLETAKLCASRIVQQLLDTGSGELVRDTNWASVVAACQAHVVGFNERLRAAIGSRLEGVGEDLGEPRTAGKPSTPS